MRITNGMMINNLARNITGNLTRMDSLQNQMSTARRFANISDDPVALIYGQSARNMMGRISNFLSSVQTAQDWLEQAEDGIMDMQRTMADLYLEVINATDDGKGSGESSSRANIAPVVGQLRDGIVDNLNVTLGNRFMFGGHNTPGDPADPNIINDRAIRPFSVENGRLHFNGFDISRFDGMPAAVFDEIFNRGEPPFTTTGIQDAFDAFNTQHGTSHAPADFGLDNTDVADAMHRLMNDTPTLIVGPGVEMPITMNGISLALFITPGPDGNAVMRNSWDVANDFYEALSASPPAMAEELESFIRPFQDAQSHLLTRTAEIGGRMRRLEMLEARFEQNMINHERMRSEAEDVDMAETLMHFRMAEAVYQAALSAGARVIQPTLMDFLR